MKKTLPILFTLSFFLFTLILSGCGPFWQNPFITVEPSNLNWVHIHYYNLNRKPIRRISVYLSGAGVVEVRKGTSEQVSNDFAKRYDADNWGDVIVNKKEVDVKHLNDVFQNLVNHGVLDRDKLRKHARYGTKFSRFMGVKANINNCCYSENDNIFEVDPDLAEVLLDVIHEYDNPLSK